MKMKNDVEVSFKISLSVSFQHKQRGALFRKFREYFPIFFTFLFFQMLLRCRQNKVVEPSHPV